MNIWSTALSLARKTPPERNRYVDLLRALSITVVVFGHWMMAAPYVEGGSPHFAHLLDVAPWSRWLTWIFQVMPVFFFVGGYSNASSWRSAVRRKQSYAHWLFGRLTRLLSPTLPLLVAWGVMGAIGLSAGLPDEMVRIASRVALVPVWFLAVYLLVQVLVPWTLKLWERLGFASIIVPVLLAGANDALFFGFDITMPSWANYLFIWLTVHQLGYAWRDGKLSRESWGAGRLLAWAGCGLAGLLLMTQLGPYPLSLVGVPSEAVSNTLPPKLPLLAMASLQIGTILAMEPGARKLLSHETPWAATVLINGMIMTVFLWHSTVMMLLFGVGLLAGGLGLHPAPGSGAWWIWRVGWLALFSVVSLPVVLGFMRFERPPKGIAGVPLWRLLPGLLLTALGLAFLALRGVVGDGPLGLALWALLLPFVGTGLAGFGPIGMWLPRAKKELPQG